MRVLLALLLVCSVSACNRPAADTSSPTAGDQTPVAAATAAAPADEPAVDTATCAFCASPAFVRTCDIAAGVRTTLHWNVTDPKITKLGIFVVDDAGKDSPFAEQGLVGSLETGPWLKPGLTFKLKDSNGNVLNTIVIKGKAC
ncbi:hypothetical protein [Thermomonas sp.]|uniref:hypothetical protein n=1 Tax=Thermomonas sp. TaxID=1971895 RepID=UPI0024874385|nr:hypothetical protein [Thermomonas sp.]MDI1254205.1 hypothetical protein [Thermomonas sp.]